MSARVAVAIVSWNTHELLARCLRSLEPDVRSGLASVWVVDNASEDGSAEMVRDEFAWAQLVASEQNLGFGPAVNVVAERTNEPWLAPSNADIELEPGALEKLLETGESSPRIGAVAPRLIMPGGDTQHSVHPFPSVHLALLFNSGLPALSPSLGDRLCLEGRWDPERGREVDWAHGAFLAVRRAAFDEAGGFDPRQWMYAEDLDLGWRLRASGWTTVYEPGARVAHEVSAAARKAFADERHARHIAAAYDWMTRRRGRLVSRIYAVLNLAGAAARWALLAIPARIAPQRFAPRRERERRYMALHRLGLRGQRG